MAKGKTAKSKATSMLDRTKVACETCKSLSAVVDNVHHICPRTGMVTHVKQKKVCIYHEPMFN